MKRALFSRVWLFALLCVGFAACSDEELPTPTPQPSQSTKYTMLGVELVAAEGNNTTQTPDGCKIYFRIYTQENKIKGFDLEAPFYGWIESRLLPHPVLELRRNELTPQSVTFSITSSSVEELYWLCVEGDEQVSRSRVLREGERAQPNTTVRLELTDLVPEQSYAIYAATKGYFEGLFSEPLRFTCPAQVEEPEEPETPEGPETPEEPITPEEPETTRRFEEDESQTTPPTQEEVVEDEEAVVDYALSFLPQYFIDGSGYAYFSTDKSIQVWPGDGPIDNFFDYRIGLFGLWAPVALYDYPEEFYYEFRLLMFQPSNGGYFQTNWFRLDMSVPHSVISPL